MYYYIFKVGFNDVVTDLKKKKQEKMAIVIKYHFIVLEVIL